jgi:glycosyltransferase EpsD
MKSILYTATSDIHLKTFHMPYLRWLKENDFEVHIAAEKRSNIDLSFVDNVHYIPFKRSPLHPVNLMAFFRLRKIVNRFQFEIIHCHTPVVSVLTRLAAIGQRRRGAKVLYTAHGYHFYNGGPFKYWLIFYPLEKLLSLLTDVIILINKEDFDLTRTKFWNKSTYYLKGIGIDSNRFRTVSHHEKILLRSKAPGRRGADVCVVRNRQVFCPLRADARASNWPRIGPRLAVNACA